MKTAQRKPQTDVREQGRLWLEAETAADRLKPVTQEQLVPIAQIIRGATQRRP